MGRFRLSIRTLLAVVAVAAVGFAAVTIASPFWVGLLTSLTWFLILAAPLGAIFGRGTRRVFWTGFALLGLGYLLLIPRFGDPDSNRLAPRLYFPIYSTLHAPDPEESEASGGGAGMGGGMGPGLGSPPGSMGGFRSMGGFGGGTVATPTVSLTDVEQICKMLEALLWAFLGGWAARYFAANRSGCTADSPRPARPLPTAPGLGSTEHRSS